MAGKNPFIVEDEDFIDESEHETELEEAGVVVEDDQPLIEEDDDAPSNDDEVEDDEDDASGSEPSSQDRALSLIAIQSTQEIKLERIADQIEALDARSAQTDRDIAQMRNLKVQAQTKGDWALVDRYDQAIGLAEKAKGEFATKKTAFEEAKGKVQAILDHATELSKQASARPTAVAAHNTRAATWAEKNKAWFKPGKASDPRTAFVVQTSQELAAKGFAADGAEHFRRLTSAVNKRFPEAKAVSGYKPKQTQGKTGSSITASAASSRAPSSKNVSVPRATAKAFKEAGFSAEDLKKYMKEVSR